MTVRGLLSVFIAGLIVFYQVSPALAQQAEVPVYRLGTGDILQIEVPQDTALGGSFTVLPDGTVTLKRVGSVAVAGLTIDEAEVLIRQRLHLYNPDIDDILVTVAEYNALSIYVLGAVQEPGAYSFRKPPTLWEAIRAAGGPVDTANMSAVRVIHQLDHAQQTHTYDLSPVLSGQGALPSAELGLGDTVIVPFVEGVAKVPPEMGVQVIGQVANPSTVHITEPTRLLTVLMRAGSPREDSKLDQIWWVHKASSNEYLANRVNLQLFLEKGSLAGNPLIYPGDSIRVPQKRPGNLLVAISVFLGLALTTATILLTINRLNE